MGERSQRGIDRAGDSRDLRPCRIARVAHLAQVAADGEIGPFRVQHYDPRLGPVDGFRHHPIDRLTQGQAEGVAVVGVAQGNPRDTVFDAEADALGHRRNTP